MSKPAITLALIFFLVALVAGSLQNNQLWDIFDVVFVICWMAIFAIAAGSGISKTT